ncbi:MAG: type II toxin-antitoxin system VapB family antitoxin [Proteobacteria bacterium]|nr:type II toxin-antitoxin system VapB family antitoxin [Pseudomonadota bacterium]
MRTTIQIDNDVLERARALSEKLRTPFRTVVNQALREGLERMKSPANHRPYQTNPHAMGIRQGHNLDNIQELLAQIEGEEFR